MYELILQALNNYRQVQKKILSYRLMDVLGAQSDEGENACLDP